MYGRLAALDNHRQSLALLLVNSKLAPRVLFFLCAMHGITNSRFPCWAVMIFSIDFQACPLPCPEQCLPDQASPIKELLPRVLHGG